MTLSNRFPQQPLDAIANNGFANPSPYSKTVAVIRQTVGQRAQYQESVGPRLSLFAYPLKILIAR